MNQDPENFNSLRRLLALKRHEQPPPGYFDRFSRDVTARIKAGERGGSVGFELPWLQRLVGIFELKPVFAGAFGMAVCAFIVTGVVSSVNTPIVGSGIARAASPSDTALGGNEPISSVNTSFVQQPMDSSTNPLVSLFDQVPLQTTPVSERFYVPSGN